MGLRPVISCYPTDLTYQTKKMPMNLPYMLFPNSLVIYHIYKTKINISYAALRILLISKKGSTCQTIVSINCCFNELFKLVL